MKPKPTFTRLITEREWSLTILWLALLFGAAVRLLPALLAGFPINDGGMFAVMIRDLRSNNYLPPLSTTYNRLDTPFVYPLLGLYLGALLESFGINYSDLFLWLPVFFAFAILPVFHLFAYEWTGSRPHAAAATSFLALSPGTYAWYLMGGGLTRAPGAIFLLFSLTFTLRAFRQSDWKPVLLSGLFCGLAVLTHPQAALLTLTGCAILWLVHGRSRRGILRAIVIAAGAALLSTPWWAVALSRHGFETLLDAGQSGDLRVSLSALFVSLTSPQTFIPFTTMFWLTGLGWAVYQRRADLLLLCFIPYFIDQRSAPIASTFVYPLFAAYGYVNALPTFVTFLRERKWRKNNIEPPFNRPAFSISLLGIIFYLFIECAFHANVIARMSLHPYAREAMGWVDESMPEESRFLIVTGRGDAMTDPVQEWFPVLANRHSATTLQGLEWILGEGFNARWARLDSLQACGGADCVISLSNEYQIEYDAILLDANHLAPGAFEERGFQIAHRNAQYVILIRK